MARPRRAARNRRPVVTETERLWAFGELTEEHPAFPTITYFTSADRLTEVWETLRDDVLLAWVAEHPGTRPALWWERDAPRSPLGTYPGWYYDGRLPLPRRRMGGTGTPAFEGLAYAPEFERGVPARWAGVDPTDPPSYESEAEYLGRLGLLTGHERARLDRDGWPEPEVMSLPDNEHPAAA
jgi:hypothetical protein